MVTTEKIFGGFVTLYCAVLEIATKIETLGCLLSCINICHLPLAWAEQPFSLVTLDKTSSAAASNYQLGVGQRGTSQDKSGQVGHNQPSHQYQCQVSAPMDVSLAHT